MSKIKNTKTSTFIFPLLEIPKNIFKCDIQNMFKRTIISSRFINAYLSHAAVGDYPENTVFLLIKNYQDSSFSSFMSTMIAFPNYVDDYEYKNYIVMIYSIPKSRIEDFNLIINGKYSEISDIGKALILENTFYHGLKPTVSLILSKNPELKASWERELSAPHPSPRFNSMVDLEEQEVWSILNEEKETLTDEIFNELFLLEKLTPSKEFE